VAYSPAGLLLLRVKLTDDFYLGPGKADLLELIAETGSIGAAGKRMEMSYKRAWSLVQVMNAAFPAPLVETTRGGSGQGGAVVTPLGQKVLTHYRTMQRKTEAAIADDITALLVDMSGKK
jgi:molybdate transport system regulatory protein